MAGSDDPRPALAAYGYEGTPTPFVEARRLQVAAWTAFMAEHHPHLRARARERLRQWRI